jgi:hypothetical protein
MLIEQSKAAKVLALGKDILYISAIASAKSG